MNVIVKMPRIIKNDVDKFENSLKDVFRDHQFNITFYKSDAQIKFVADESIFTISTSMTMDNNFCYICLKNDIDTKLKDFIIKNAKDMVVVLDLECTYRDNKCYIDRIKTADVIFKSDIDVIAKEWTEIDPMRSVMVQCPKCNRPLEVSLNRPEYTCTCNSGFKMERMHNIFYGSGYMVRALSKN